MYMYVETNTSKMNNFQNNIYYYKKNLENNDITRFYVTYHKIKIIFTIYYKI